MLTNKHAKGSKINHLSPIDHSIQIRQNWFRGIELDKMPTYPHWWNATSPYLSPPMNHKERHHVFNYMEAILPASNLLSKMTEQKIHTEEYACII